ncbi:MAG: hypothetical protein ACT6SD_11765 [Brevundimonas sp.]|uniref:hypothetical protein n=1 Tax=Brevundimonas sp. TaxID=1871086 RepID=UPI004033927E
MRKRSSVIGMLAFLLGVGSFIGGCAQTRAAGDLSWSPEPGMDFALGPRLTGPGVDGINSALEAIDGQAQARRADCLAAAGEVASWIRTVWTPYVGPRFLTVAVSDQTNCGGAHPNDEITYYTFDRMLDDVPDWATLWPGVLVSVANPGGGGLAARTGSPALWTWYVDAVRRDASINPELKRMCMDRLGPASEGEDLAIWLDGASGGLGMKLSDLPRAAAACGFVQIMPADEMGRLGASDALLRELRAAPAAFDYSEMPR